MRAYYELILGAFFMIAAVGIGYVLYSSLDLPKATQTANVVSKKIVEQFELIDYGVQNGVLRVYLKPTTKVNISSIKAEINQQPVKVIEIGNGDGIIDPSENEMVELIYNSTNISSNTLSVVVSGYNVPFMSFDLPVPEEMNVTVPPPTISYCSWYYSTFNCRTPIYIQFSGTSGVMDFQFNLSLDTQSLINSNKMQPTCNDIRFTALYPYEGTRYYDSDKLVLSLHLDKDTKDYSGLSTISTLTEGTYTNAVFNYGVENATISIQNITSVNSFTITLWAKFYNNTWKPPSDWWNTSWKYRIGFNISNSNSFDVFYKPIKFVIDTLGPYTLGKINSDLSDIRVIEKLPAHVFVIYNPNSYDLINYQLKIDISTVPFQNFSLYNMNTSTYLLYCFEQPNGECNTTRTNYIWIKIDKLAANAYTYIAAFPEPINNATLGYNVFDIYDDFSDGVINSTLWTVYTNQGNVYEQNGKLYLEVTSTSSGDYYGGIHSNYVVQYPSIAEANVTSATSGAYFDLGFSTDTNIGQYGLLYPGYSNEWNVGSYVILAIGGSSWGYVSYVSYSDTAPQLMGFSWVDTGSEKVYMNGNLLIDGTDTTYTINNYYLFLVNEYTANSVVEVEWVRVRKYADSIPSVSSEFDTKLDVEIPFIFETDTGFNNTDNPSSDTWIWAKVKYIPGNGNETVYIYYGNPAATERTYTISDILNTSQFMILDKIVLPTQATAGQWFGFTFPYTFSMKPIVIAQPDVTYTGPDPLTIWIKNITTSDFYARQKEPSDKDDIHITETVYYIALPPGVWETTGGVIIEANRFNTTTWIPGEDLGATPTWNTVSYSVTFNNPPVVISQLDQIDDTLTTGWEAHTRLDSITTTTFNTAPEPEGSVTTAPTINVELAWIAIQQHVGNLAKYVKSEAGFTGNVVNENLYTITFSQTYNSPGFLGWIATYNGADSSRLRGTSLTSDSISVFVQEDTSYDTETDHVTEDVGYFVFEAQNTPIKIYLIPYIPGINLYVGQEESIVLERKKVFEKTRSFGIEVYENNLYAFINTTNGYYEVSTSINLNELYFITAKYDGTTLSLFLNNNLVNQTSASGTIINSYPYGTIDFLGLIDEVRLYNTSLSDGRISEEFNISLEKAIPYWIDEATCDTTNTMVYVKIPDLPIGNSTIYMYYCDPSATSESNGTNTFIFFDDLENFVGWTQYGSGQVVQDCSVYYSPSCSAHKINNNDPNGAYKDIGITLGRDIILEFWVNRNPSYAGGPADRIGLIDDSGNGYGWVVQHYYDYIGIDKRTGYSGTVVTSTSITDVMGEWVFGRFIIESDGTITSERYVNGTLSGRIFTTDTAYNSFTRVYIFGGYDYWVDDIRIRKYISPWPTYSFGSEETC